MLRCLFPCVQPHIYMYVSNDLCFDSLFKYTYAVAVVWQFKITSFGKLRVAIWEKSGLSTIGTGSVS